MAFCGNCGTKTEDNVKFCPSCGTVIGVAEVGKTAQQASGYIPPVVPGAPQQADIRDAQDGKTMGILAYILFFIPLLTGAHKTSPFVKYHTNQGTVLFLTALAWGIIENMLLAILRAVLWNVYAWELYSLLATILNILWLAPTILCIVGIINVVNGRMKPLPVIGGISIIK